MEACGSTLSYEMFHQTDSEMVRDCLGMWWREEVSKCQENLRQSPCLRCATILFRAAGLNALT